MNFQQSAIVKSVNNFSAYGNDLVVVKDDGIYLNGEALMTSVPNPLTSLFNIAFFVKDGSLVYGNRDSETRFYLKENRKQQIRPDWSYYWETLSENKIIVSNNRRKENDRRVADYYQYDFSTDELVNLNLTEYPNFYYGNGNAFMIEENKWIRKYDLTQSALQWKFDLTSLNFPPTDNELALRQIIGIKGNEFLLALTNKEILSLHVDTGEVLWHTTGFVADHLNDFRNQSLASFCYWHLEGDQLFQLDGNRYLSVDLSTRAVEVLWEDTREEDYITIVHKTYTPDLIYFTAAKNYAISPNLTGVFNRKTLNIDWLMSPDSLKGSLNQPPQLAGDTLYVRDTGKVLHIFKNIL